MVSGKIVYNSSINIEQSLLKPYGRSGSVTLGLDQHTKIPLFHIDYY